jgi:capsule polysaccharide modification protein KpsS
MLNERKYFAINNKDAHLKKKNMLKLIFSKYAFLAFFYKIKQLLLNEKSEFRNLHIHLIDFVNRAINYAINIFFSLKRLNTINNFIYFPLHVPRDLALTLRAPECLDQIRSLKSVVTQDQSSIVFKEHPLIFSRYNYFKIAKQFINASFLDNNLPSNQIIKKSKFVITINSKAGLETLALGKPVLTLKKNYYCGKGLAFYCSSKKMFRSFEKNIKLYNPNKIKVKKLLMNLTKKTLYFDLYNNEKRSLKKSSESLRKILSICL